MGGVVFTGLGVLPSGQRSEALAVSDHGRTVVGYSYQPQVGEQAFRWTPEQGMVSMQGLGGFSRSNSLSRNGLVLGGSANNASDGYRVVRWTASGEITSLGLLPTGFASLGYGVSSDGSTVVGSCNTTNAIRAIRWRAETGLLDLGVLPGHSSSLGSGTNGDGSVVVGDCESGLDKTAFRWSTTGGMVSIGRLPGSLASYALATSDDGSVIAGASFLSRSGQANTQPRAIRWTSATGMVNLGGLPNHPDSRGVGISGDGSVIVGWFSDSNDVANGAFMWTQSTGMLDLNAFLPSQGASIDGWVLTKANGISRDGTAIVGVGLHNGVPEGWLVRFLSCGSADFDGDGTAGSDSDIEAFFACLAGNCCLTCGSADFNGDGDVGTDSDIEAFFRVLGGGSC
jgi:probable HAF family extracellular repeat protein